MTCWLDPDELTTTWVANKAVYRTRMALADGGELVVLAPGVSRFGEDPTIDTLIRRHGYRGTPAALAAVRTRSASSPTNLGAAAHLIHGSSEGRFRIVYCTDPDDRRPHPRRGRRRRLRMAARCPRSSISSASTAAPRPERELDRDGAPFTHIANPALGLWATAERFP